MQSPNQESLIEGLNLFFFTALLGFLRRDELADVSAHVRDILGCGGTEHPRANYSLLLWCLHF